MSAITFLLNLYPQKRRPTARSYRASEGTNRITGSKVTAILLTGWILPIGGASAVKGLHLQPAQQAFYPFFTSPSSKFVCMNVFTMAFV